MKGMKINMLAAMTAVVAVALTACGSPAAHSSSGLSVVLADGTDREAAQLADQLTAAAGKAGSSCSVTVTAADFSDAVAAVREGKADCGYGLVPAEDAIQYGVIKSEVVQEQRMALLSAQEITSVSELNRQKIGYLETLGEPFLSFLKGSTGGDIHSYRSEEQLLSDLHAGLLEAAAFEQEQAIQIWKASPDLRLSQPEQLPVAAYRFWGTQKEKVELTQSLWKENTDGIF